MCTYIDLFAGAGGLSEGFMKAGFVPVAHVESDYYACLTLKTRAAYYYLKKGKYTVYKDYLSGKITREELYNNVPKDVFDTIINKEISKRTIPAIFKQISNNMKKAGIKKIDVVVGGPPCQPFSMMYRHKLRKKAFTDPRINLYKFYCEFLKKYNPHMIVFENVQGLISAGENRRIFPEIMESIRGLGYTLDFKILDASNFGVKQTRKRLIIIASKDKKFKYPKFDIRKIEGTVNDIFSDLPHTRSGHDASSEGYMSQKIHPSIITSGIRSINNDILTLHVARPNNERDLKIYKIATELWNKERKRLSYSDLPPELITMKNLKDFQDRFKVVAGNEEFSHTVVAHISKDGHYYIHPDKNQNRSITVREAARLQSFPDNYYFEGPRTASFRQIGNAVPVLMAEAIALRVKNIMRKNKK